MNQLFIYLIQQIKSNVRNFKKDAETSYKKNFVHKEICIICKQRAHGKTWQCQIIRDKDPIKLTSALTGIVEDFAKAVKYESNKKKKEYRPRNGNDGSKKVKFGINALQDEADAEDDDKEEQVMSDGDANDSDSTS